MQLLREGDGFIGDAQVRSSERATITQGLWILDVHRWSELYNSSGDRRAQLLDGSWMKQLKSTHKKEGFDADGWMDAVQGQMSEWEAEGNEMGLWKLAAVRVGQMVGWIEEDHWYVGRVTQGAPLEEGWSGEVQIEKWRATDNEDDYRSGWSREMLRREWPSHIPQVWEVEPGGETKHGKKWQVFPITVVTMDTAEGDSAPVRVWIDEREEVFERWYRMYLEREERALREEGRLGSEGPDSAAEAEEPTDEETEGEAQGHEDRCGSEGPDDSPGRSTEETGAGDGSQAREAWVTGWQEWASEEGAEADYYPGKDELKGYHQGIELRERTIEWIRSTAEAIRKEGRRAVLITYSDASVKMEGKGGSGTYAWLIGGFEGGPQVPPDLAMSGGGRVHGPPLLLSSTRAEHVGVCSLLTALNLWGPKLQVYLDGHEHFLDNKGVTSRMEHGVRGPDTVYSPADWARANDPDVHAEAEVQRDELGLQTWVRWHRGHPERRAHRDDWSCHDKAIYRVDELADEEYNGIEGLQEGWWQFPNKPTYELRWRGLPLAGAKMRKQLVGAMQEEALKVHLVSRWSRQALKKEKGRRAQADIAWVRGDQEKFRKKEEARLWAAMEDPLQAFWIDGHKCIGIGQQSLTDRIITVKIMAGILRTAGGVVGRGDKGQCHDCRLCGKATDGGETQYHVLWECTGCAENDDGEQPTLKAAREEMVAAIMKVLQDCGLGMEAQAVMSAVWQLKEGEATWSSAEQVFQEHGISSDSARVRWGLIRDMEQGMAGEGLLYARRGILGAPWVKMLQASDKKISRGQAREVCEKISRKVQVGCTTMWRLFGKAVAGDEDAGANEVSEEVQQAFDVGVLSRQQMRMVSKMSDAQQAVWVARYTALREDGSTAQTAFNAGKARASRVRDDGTTAIGIEEWSVQKSKERKASEAQRRAAQSSKDRDEAKTMAYMMDLGRRSEADKLSKGKGQDRTVALRGKVRAVAQAPAWQQKRGSKGPVAQRAQSSDDGVSADEDDDPAQEAAEHADGRDSPRDDEEAGCAMEDDMVAGRKRSKRARFSDEESDDDAGQAIQKQAQEERRMEACLNKYHRACKGAPRKVSTVAKSTTKKVNDQKVNEEKVNEEKVNEEKVNGQKVNGQKVNGQKVNGKKSQEKSDGKKWQKKVSGEKSDSEEKSDEEKVPPGDWQLQSGPKIDSGDAGLRSDDEARKAGGGRRRRLRRASGQMVGDDDDGGDEAVGAGDDEARGGKNGDGDGDERGGARQEQHGHGQVQGGRPGFRLGRGVGVDSGGAGSGEWQGGSGPPAQVEGEEQAHAAEVAVVREGAVRMGEASGDGQVTGRDDAGGGQAALNDVVEAGAQGLGLGRRQRGAEAAQGHGAQGLVSGETVRLPGYGRVWQVSAGAGSADALGRGGGQRGRVTEGGLVDQGAAAGRADGGADSAGDSGRGAGLGCGVRRAGIDGDGDGCGGGLDGLHPEPEGSCARGSCLPALRQTGMGLLQQIWQVGAQFASGFTGSQWSGVVGQGAGRYAGQVRGEGADRQGVFGDVPMLQDLQQGGLVKHHQGAQLQEVRQGPPHQTTQGRHFSEGAEGAQGGQDGQAWHQGSKVLREDTAGTVLSGEPCGQSVQEAIHARLGGGWSEEGRGALLRLQALLPQAYSSVDEHDGGHVVAQGQHRYRKVRRQVQQRQPECSREVDAHLQDSAGQQTGQGRQRQEGQQEYDAAGAPRGGAAGSWNSNLNNRRPTRQEKKKAKSGEFEPQCGPG
jgi:hypothetical protein